MKFITFRRHYLDKMLSESNFSGRVLDIGGKKDNKRGTFRPRMENVLSWQYLNIDESTMPDYCCSAENIPVNDGHFDTALMCEVIEHLEKPELVIKESYRILRKGGVLIMTSPFLFPFHADPYDFQRFTDVKLRALLNNSGFSEIDIRAMGGIGSVIHDLLFVAFGKIQGGHLLRKALGIIRPFFLYADKYFKSSEKNITTGFFVMAKK